MVFVCPTSKQTMNPISLIFLSFAMSTDAFAAAIAKGAALYKPKMSQALRMGIIFGVIEACITLIGWLVGSLASSFIEQWDHWLAFSLLTLLGGHMIYNGFQEEEEDDKPKGNKHGFMLLALTAVATSIDSLAVGVGLAFIQVNIWVASGAIGFATFMMVTIGTFLGKVIGQAVGKKAEMIGGVILIIVGIVIVYEHVFAS